jgi:AmmeMemoRadiSam system protein A
MKRLLLLMAASFTMEVTMARAQDSTNAPTSQNATNTAVLTDQDKTFLLKLARETITLYLKDGSSPKVDEKNLSDNLKQKLACFVTLNHRRSGLRGCIGMFERTTPLYKNVISRAIAASTQDTRFEMPVALSELKDIQIEISVLTEPKDLPFTSPEDLLAKLRPNIDGVILYTRHGYGQSTFLPQVWEQLPDKEEFLGHLCMKHGAPAKAWKTDYKNTRVQIYQAVVFHEPGYGGTAKD